MAAPQPATGKLVSGNMPKPACFTFFRFSYVTRFYGKTVLFIIRLSFGKSETPKPSQSIVLLYNSRGNVEVTIAH